MWAARLACGRLTEADRATLDAWLEADPEHRWVLGRYREIEARLDVQAEIASESLALAARVRQRRWRRAAAVGLAMAAAVAVMFTVLRRPGDFETRTAERHVAALPDGSRVELNAQSALAVEFRRDERHVRLLRGEAWFQVTKDAARPFVVETAAGSVWVTGTVFNVRAAQPGRAEVTVLEGTVRVRAPGSAAEEPVVMGRQAVLTNGIVAVRSLPEGAAADAAAWRQGHAVFEETSLREALEKFAPYHTRVVTVEPGVAELRIGGRYSLDDLDGLLEAITRLLPVRVVPGDAGAVRIVASGG